MIVIFWVAGEAYRADLSKGQSVAIPLLPNGLQPNHFGAPIAKKTPLKAGQFIGDTRQGGSCNVDALNMVPHCNGTHTETVSHIIDELVSPATTITQSMFPATLISLFPQKASDCEEYYAPGYDPDNRIISKDQLVHLLSDTPTDWLAGLLVRTLPNPREKRFQQYDQQHYPPYFSNEAINYLVARGVKHLMVDFPSIDKMYDEGLMSNHHLFWQVEPGERRANHTTRRQATVSEMLFIDDSITDGRYLCQLQPMAVETDAVPTNPVLYKALAND